MWAALPRAFEQAYGGDGCRPGFWTLAQGTATNPAGCARDFQHPDSGLRPCPGHQRCQRPGRQALGGRPAPWSRAGPSICLWPGFLRTRLRARWQRAPAPRRTPDARKQSRRLGYESP
eukprot:13054325-Alexandrium_andersonii.AAC.1